MHTIIYITYIHVHIHTMYINSHGDSHINSHGDCQQKSHVEAKGDIFEISISSMVQSYSRKPVTSTCILFRLGHICFERADQVRHLNQFLVRA